MQEHVEEKHLVDANLGHSFLKKNAQHLYQFGTSSAFTVL